LSVSPTRQRVLPHLIEHDEAARLARAAGSGAGVEDRARALPDGDRAAELRGERDGGRARRGVFRDAEPGDEEA
jgi:hypothetical protein